MPPMTRLPPALGIAVVASVIAGSLAPSALAASINPTQDSVSSRFESTVHKAEVRSPIFTQTKNSSSGNPPVNGGPGNTQGSGTR